MPVNILSPPERGSQPHVALLELLREDGREVRRVHAISSISATVRLVDGGFGVLALPLDAVLGIGRRQAIRPLPKAPKLPALPILINFREGPTDPTVAVLVDSARRFADASDKHRKK